MKNKTRKHKYKVGDLLVIQDIYIGASPLPTRRALHCGWITELVPPDGSLEMCYKAAWSDEGGRRPKVYSEYHIDEWHRHALKLKKEFGL